MSIKNKYIILLIIIVLAIALIYLFNINKKPIDQGQNQNTTPSENGKNISIRDKMINSFYDNYELGKTLKVGDREFRVISYGAGEGNRMEEPKSSGGIIAFEREKEKWEIFWESSEFFSESFPDIEIRDLTNDKIDEMILKNTSLSGRNLGLAVYTWRNGKFEIVTRTREVITSIGKYVSLDLGGDVDKTKIEDIDGDNIYEIIIGYKWQEMSGAPVEEYQQIYKYDGDKYYLWKEEKIGEEKSEY